MLKIEAKKAFELNAIHGFRGIVYDGLWFYLTVEDENKIIKFDVSFNQIESFETCRCYRYICYDPIEDCFWAIDRDDSSCIYKLNNLFVQIDKLDISILGVKGRKINGISHNYRLDRLLLSFSNMIVSLDKHSLNDYRILGRSRNKRIRGVTDLFSSYICHGISKSKQEIRISSLHGRFINRIYVPSCLRIASMVSVPNTRNRGESHLYLLLTHRNGGQLVIKCIVEDYSIIEHKKRCCMALESIALEGSMIAHSLNVESDKQINIIQSSNNPWEINTSITLLSKLIDRAANQEIKLTDKIQKLMEHCDF